MEPKLVGIEMGDGQRMRRVVSRSNHRVTGKHPSWKRKCMVYWESAIERDAFRRLDADCSVLAYEEQPAQISYLVEGETLVHYPDVLVTWEGSRGFLEIKCDADAARPNVRERTSILTKLLWNAGFTYRVWPASEIRAQPCLENDIYLLRHGRCQVPPVERERIRRLFREAPSIPWEMLARKLLGPEGLNYMARLVLEGMLVIDRDAPITPDSAVRLNDATGSQS